MPHAQYVGDPGACPECGAQDGAADIKAPSDIGAMVASLERISDGSPAFNAAVGALRWVLGDRDDVPVTGGTLALPGSAQRPQRVRAPENCTGAIAGDESCRACGALPTEPCAWPHDPHDTTFSPNWTIRPGDTLQDLIDERGMTLEALAVACRLSTDAIRGVLRGDVITDDTAARIAAGTDTSERFWINRERIYREDLAKGRTDTSREVA